jgi:threonylcarbamoyladenosine tRNA methylthiotransferase MtaB
MKVTLLTLGCRVNQSESAVIEGSLQAAGATIVDLNDNPDFCIVNTCTVTAKSDYNSRQIIRRAAKTGARIIVTGCYSQLRPDVVGEIPGVVRVVGNEKKFEIPQLLSDEPTPLFFGSYRHSRPSLKVQDGCNFRCSYCAVPRARGNSRSVAAEEVVRRVREIVAGGYKELVLTGIHLGTYGHDLPEKITLNILIKKILQDTKIHRIRLSSLEVGEVDDELIEIFQDKRICKHLHVPLQSGSNRVLKLMKRTYNIGNYTSRIEAIISRTDNLSLGTDIIIGFPGE